MFHDNYKIYQIDFDKYNIEIEYWNKLENKKENLNFDCNKEQLNKIVDFLYNLGFDDNTPEEGEF